MCNQILWGYGGKPPRRHCTGNLPARQGESQWIPCPDILRRRKATRYCNHKRIATEPTDYADVSCRTVLQRRSHSELDWPNKQCPYCRRGYDEDLAAALRAERRPDGSYDEAAVRRRVEAAGVRRADEDSDRAEARKAEEARAEAEARRLEEDRLRARLRADEEARQRAADDARLRAPNPQTGPNPYPRAAPRWDYQPGFTDNSQFVPYGHYPNAGLPPARHATTFTEEHRRATERAAQVVAAGARGPIGNYPNAGLPPARRTTTFTEEQRRAAERAAEDAFDGARSNYRGGRRRGRGQ